MRSARELMARIPGGAGNWLCALDFYLSPTKEVVIIGDAGDSRTQTPAREVHRSHIPNRVLVGHGDGSEPIDGVPLLEDRHKVDGRPTAYVCRNYVCNLPAIDPSVLAAQLVE